MSLYQRKSLTVTSIEKPLLILLSYAGCLSRALYRSISPLSTLYDGLCIRCALNHSCVHDLVRALKLVKRKSLMYTRTNIPLGGTPYRLLSLY